MLQAEARRAPLQALPTRSVLVLDLQRLLVDAKDYLVVERVMGR